MLHVVIVGPAKTRSAVAAVCGGRKRGIDRHRSIFGE
jgi:hypothetical protein